MKEGTSTKGLIKKLQADSVGWWSFWISCFIFFVDFVVIAILYHTLPPYLPLYNHMPWGYERLGSTIQIVIPLSIPLFLFIANTIYAGIIREKNILLSRFLYITNLSLALFVTIFLLRLLQVIL